LGWDFVVEVELERCEIESADTGGAPEVGAPVIGFSALKKHWVVLPLRTRAMIGILLLLCGLYLYSEVALQRSARNLEQVAQKEIEGVHSDTNDVVWEVTVSRPYVLFGKAQGKVEVFVLQKESSGPTPAIHSVSFYYLEEGDAWKLDGSGASGSEESQAQGLKAFARQKPEALKGL